MNRPAILLAVAFSCLCGTVSRAEDYLLQAETLGYVDVSVSDQQPEETVLHRFEILVRPQSTFHG